MSIHLNSEALFRAPSRKGNADDANKGENNNTSVPRNHLRKPSSEPTSPLDMKANNNMALAKPSPSAYFSTSGKKEIGLASIKTDIYRPFCHGAPKAR